MKFTEEKWMKEKFGEKYATYCKKVNRIIPWVRRNPSKIFEDNFYMIDLIVCVGKFRNVKVI